MKFRLPLLLATAGLCFVALTTQAQAQATRTWVSGVGDDANPCSRTAPCKTFPGAYSKTAAGGEIDALDPGGFGTISIGKALTIDGGGGQVASILASSTSAVNVNAGANDNIILRNLRMNGINQSNFPGTSAIIFNSGHSLTVENCYIFDFSQFGISFSPVVRSFLNVIDSVIENNTTGGLVSSSTATTGGANRVNIVRSSFVNNGFGIKSGTNSNVAVKDGLISNNNADSGVLATGTGAEITLESTVVSNNQVSGMHATNNGQVRMSNVTAVYNNGPAWEFDAGGVVSSWGNNREVGNAAISATPNSLPLR